MTKILSTLYTITIPEYGNTEVDLFNAIIQGLQTIGFTLLTSNWQDLFTNNEEVKIGFDYNNEFQIWFDRAAVPNTATNRYYFRFIVNGVTYTYNTDSSSILRNNSSTWNDTSKTGKMGISFKYMKTDNVFIFSLHPGYPDVVSRICIGVSAININSESYVSIPYFINSSSHMNFFPSSFFNKFVNLTDGNSTYYTYVTITDNNTYNYLHSQYISAPVYFCDANSVTPIPDFYAGGGLASSVETTYTDGTNNYYVLYGTNANAILVKY